MGLQGGLESGCIYLCSAETSILPPLQLFCFLLEPYVWPFFECLTDLNWLVSAIATLPLLYTSCFLSPRFSSTPSISERLEPKCEMPPHHSGHIRCHWLTFDQPPTRAMDSFITFTSPGRKQGSLSRLKRSIAGKLRSKCF